MVSFVAIDVETANAFMGSICQIGMVRFRDGVEVEAANWLINPGCDFDGWNVRIHGITAETVANAPQFSAIHQRLTEFIGSDLLACHTHFDRTAIRMACETMGAPPLASEWLDTRRIALRTWKLESYRLRRVAKHLGIKFRHHDAEEDARAAGHILLRAIEDSGIGLAGWSFRAERPVDDRPLKLEGRDDGPLMGERIVFTGRLCVPRRTAAERANKLGAAIDPGVTKHTTMLVVGDQDLHKLNGAEKSAKHLKAEAMIEKGADIRIVGESDFMWL